MKEFGKSLWVLIIAFAAVFLTGVLVSVDAETTVIEPVGQWSNQGWVIFLAVCAVVALAAVGIFRLVRDMRH
jgi:uncharacterized membrane protein (DUF2068 family)